MGENIIGGGNYSQTTRKSNFFRHFCIFGLNIYLTTGRMRRRQSRDVFEPGRLSQKKSCVTKRILYAETFGRCQCCGREFEYKRLELHHVLAWWRFPEYDGDIRNSRLLCHECHKAIHLNPFVESSQILEVAGTLGIENVRECYKMPANVKA